MQRGWWWWRGSSEASFEVSFEASSRAANIKFRSQLANTNNSKKEGQLSFSREGPHGRGGVWARKMAAQLDDAETLTRLAECPVPEGRVRIQCKAIGLPRCATPSGGVHRARNACSIIARGPMAMDEGSETTAECSASSSSILMRPWFSDPLTSRRLSPTKMEGTATSVLDSGPNNGLQHAASLAVLSLGRLVVPLLPCLPPLLLPMACVASERHPAAASRLMLWKGLLAAGGRACAWWPLIAPVWTRRFVSSAAGCVATAACSLLLMGCRGLSAIRLPGLPKLLVLTGLQQQASNVQRLHAGTPART